MKYYNFICFVIGNLFFICCGLFVGFFAIYGTYKSFFNKPLWPKFREKFIPKYKEQICEYGKYKFKIYYLPIHDFGKTQYALTIEDLQTKESVKNMTWFSNIFIINKRFKKICKDFNRCAPWVSEMVQSQINRSKTDT